MQEIQPSLLKNIIIKQDESTFCRFKKTIQYKNEIDAAIATVIGEKPL
jgi:hypothetical protein